MPVELNKNGREVFAPHSGADFGAGYQPPPAEPQQEYGGFLTSSFDLENKRQTVNRTLDMNPEVGPQVERLIQQYPTITEDQVVALVNQQTFDPNSPLIAAMVRKGERLAANANSDSMFGRAYNDMLKVPVRNAFQWSEDLYNNMPAQTIPRFLIQREQGRSLRDSFEMATPSSITEQIRANRAGVPTWEGAAPGFFPTTEVIPKDELYIQRIQELTLSGELEGSPEEQIYQAQLIATLEQLDRTGVAASGLAHEQWNSTLLHKTVNGYEHVVSYSPGKGIGMAVSYPGQLMYQASSAFIDGSFRMMMEPVDIAADAAIGTAVRSVNPTVISDALTFTNRGSSPMWGATTDLTGIEHVIDPILTPDGKVAKAVTDSAEGTIKADPEEIAAQYTKRIEDLKSGDGKKWSNPDSPYAKPYIEMGLSPNDVLHRIQQAGGENGEFFLTFEHELVHMDTTPKWFEVNEVDGTRVVNKEVVFDDAPDEVHQLVDEIHERGVTYDDIQVASEAVDGLKKPVEDASDALAAAKGRRTKGLTASEKAAHNKEIGRLERELSRLKKADIEARRVLNVSIDTRSKIDNAITEIQEHDAITKAWERMENGTWKAPDIYRKAKRDAGLVSKWRPWTNPLFISEFIPSKRGQNTLQRLADMDLFQDVAKRTKYLDPQTQLAITKSKNKDEIGAFIQDAFNSNQGMRARPQLGFMSDVTTSTMDAWTAAPNFLGGAVARAARTQGRRMGASTADNIFTTTDLSQNIATVQSQLNTARVDPKKTSDLIEYAIRNHGNKAAIDTLYDRTVKLIIEAELDRTGDLYDAADLQKMFDDWRGYELQSGAYWIGNQGKENRSFWTGTHFVRGSNIPDIQPQAFLEAQFSASSRTMPDVRRMRRLTSKNRVRYERIKSSMADAIEGAGFAKNKELWTPLGFDSTMPMRVGDFTFGLWRDAALLRAGWAMRILPEEQLRFGASGYSGLFNHPLDYITSAFNKLDFTIQGDELTLGELLKREEALGTGSVLGRAALRDLRTPGHVVKGNNWTVANRLRNPKQFWAAITREIILDSKDRTMGRLARSGREETLEWMMSPEGRELRKEIAAEAAKSNPLSKVTDDVVVAQYLDAVELRLAQIGGGEGIWRQPTKLDIEGRPLWEDLNGNQMKRMEDYANKGELQAAIKALDPDATISMNRPELEAKLADLQGYSIEALEREGRAAHVMKEGHASITELIGTGSTGDIVITDDMPFNEVRALDGKLNTLYDDLELENVQQWPVAEGELAGPSRLGAKADELVSTAFHWLNSVPSQMLNRQPFFQQAMGAKLAQVYMFGDTDMRNAIDAIRAENKSFDIMMGVGERKLFRDLGVAGNPPALGKIARRDRNEVPPIEAYMDAVEAGDYDMIPLDEGGAVTNELFKVFEELGLVRMHRGADMGMYSRRHGDRYGGATRAQLYEDLVFHSGEFGPRLNTPMTEIDRLEASRYNVAKRQGLGYDDDYDEIWQNYHTAEASHRQWLEELGPDDETTRVWAARKDKLDEQLRELQPYVEEIDSKIEAQRKILDEGDWEEAAQTELRNANRGGFSTLLERSLEYANAPQPFTTIVRKSHLPEYAQEHIRTVGDVEQLHSLRELQLGALHAIGDFPERWYKMTQEFQLPGDRALITDEMLKWFEGDLGRKLTDQEATEIRGLRKKRWEYRELVLVQDDIPVVAQVPSDIMRSFFDLGFVPTSNRQVGDAALMIDGVTTQTQAMFPEAPAKYMPEFQPSSGFGEGFDPHSTFNKAIDDEDNGSFQMMVEMIDNHNTDKNIVTMAMSEGVPEGPELVYQFHTYLSSPKFRWFSSRLREEAETFMQQFQSADDIVNMTDDQLAQLHDLARASRFQSEGRHVQTDELDHITETLYGERDLTDDVQAKVFTWEINGWMQEIIQADNAYQSFVRQHGDKYIPTSPDDLISGQRINPDITPEGVRDMRLNLDGFDQTARNAATDKLGPRLGHNFDQMDSPNVRNAAPREVQQDLTEIMNAAKYDSIEETKALFYDLAGKSNVADAMKFVFPFGDAWYEVMSRWANLMSPIKNGGQAQRNFRRAMTTTNAARESGFFSTNEYGEEVFNMNVAPGMLANHFLPDEVQLEAQVPLANMMFIDFSARSIGGPATAPWIQVGAKFADPVTDNIPMLNEFIEWANYGSKDKYRPDSTQTPVDVFRSFMPTWVNRGTSAIFDDQHRETYGNTKQRMFEALLASGNEEFNPTNPTAVQHAWDVASTAGTWLSWLRVFDAGILPGQPQYHVKFAAGDDFTQQQQAKEAGPVYDEAAFKELMEAPIEVQVVAMGILSLQEEYRLAREWFPDAEAESYMLERYGVLPAVLQGASTGLVERPVTFGGVQHLEDNPWIEDIMPITAAFMIPPDVDERFSAAAWEKLFHERLQIEGVENQPIRRTRSPSEITQLIQRSLGYEQLKFKQTQYDQAVARLRATYGDGYANKTGYRTKKNEYDKAFQTIKEDLYTQFPNLRGSARGLITGSTIGVSTTRMVEELIQVGTSGTAENSQFRNEDAEMADVAETYADWFVTLRAYSLAQDDSTSAEWWLNSSSGKGEAVRQALASQAEEYFHTLNPRQRAYATKLNQRVLDPLMKDHEWLGKKFVPQLDTFPSMRYFDTLNLRE